MKKMYIDQIHTGLNTLALSMDAQWFARMQPKLSEMLAMVCIRAISLPSA